LTSYSLRGDRDAEYRFTTDHILELPGHECLDVGPGKRAALGVYARDKGWDVKAVDINVDRQIPGITWYHAALAKMAFDPEQFRLILNISSLEHFGIPGRYGITRFQEDVDIQAMELMCNWLSPAGRMILTLPVGPDTIFAPHHRIYGRRLDRLLEGYNTIDARFWNKQDGIDLFRPCSAGDAFTTVPTLEPHHYYAIGGFILERSNEN